MDINLRIKEVREKLNLSQVAFAESLGYTQVSVSNYEKGRRIPDITFVYKLLEIYNIDINWLLTGEGEMLKNSIVVDTNLDADSQKILELMQYAPEAYKKKTIDKLEEFKKLTEE